MRVSNRFPSLNDASFLLPVLDGIVAYWGTEQTEENKRLQCLTNEYICIL